MSLSLILMASPRHSIEMLAYSELSDQKRAFNRHMAPDALDIGAYHPDIATQLAGSDVVYAGFQCEPYTISGLQLEEKDRRAIQCPQTTAVIKAVLPHIAVFENVSEFYNNDYRHGVFTKARHDLRDTMHSHDPLIFYDSQVGGALCRRRGFALWENLEAHHTLKPWNPQVQFGPAKSPDTWALTGSDIPEDLWVKGILHRKSPQPTLVTDSPTVVGQVTFPLPGSSPQPGVSYKLRKGTYRLDTVYPNGQCRMMNTYRQAPEWARETVVAQSTLASMTPTPMSYPVYSSSCSLLSLRSWGEFPIGNHCLIMGQHHGDWQARRTSVYEQWCWVHTTMSLTMQRHLYDLLLTCADEPYVR